MYNRIYLLAKPGPLTIISETNWHSYWDLTIVGNLQIQGFFWNYSWWNWIPGARQAGRSPAGGPHEAGISKNNLEFDYNIIVTFMLGFDYWDLTIGIWLLGSSCRRLVLLLLVIKTLQLSLLLLIANPLLSLLGLTLSLLFLQAAHCETHIGIWL